MPRLFLLVLQAISRADLHNPHVRWQLQPQPSLSQSDTSVALLSLGVLHIESFACPTLSSVKKDVEAKLSAHIAAKGRPQYMGIIYDKH